MLTHRRRKHHGPLSAVTPIFLPRTFDLQLTQRGIFVSDVGPYIVISIPEDRRRKSAIPPGVREHQEVESREASVVRS